MPTYRDKRDKSVHRVRAGGAADRHMAKSKRFEKVDAKPKGDSTPTTDGK